MPHHRWITKTVLPPKAPVERHRMLREYTVHTHILGKDGGDVHDEASMNAMGRRLKENSINF